MSGWVSTGQREQERKLRAFLEHYGKDPLSGIDLRLLEATPWEELNNNPWLRKKLDEFLGKATGTALNQMSTVFLKAGEGYRTYLDMGLTLAKTGRNALLDLRFLENRMHRFERFTAAVVDYSRRVRAIESPKGLTLVDVIEILAIRAQGQVFAVANGLWMSMHEASLRQAVEVVVEDLKLILGQIDAYSSFYEEFTVLLRKKRESLCAPVDATGKVDDGVVFLSRLLERGIYYGSGRRLDDALMDMGPVNELRTALTALQDYLTLWANVVQPARLLDVRPLLAQLERSVVAFRNAFDDFRC